MSNQPIFDARQFAENLQAQTEPSEIAALLVTLPTELRIKVVTILVELITPQLTIESIFPQAVLANTTAVAAEEAKTFQI